jgi:Putative auto-transporter adhesin, head GIN domain
MNARPILISIFVLAMLSMSCNLLSNIGIKRITPSDVSISENRDVSGFDAIDFSSFGKVNIIQGDVESLNISGPDNIVPLIKTYVRNGTLVIETDSGLTFGPSSSIKDNLLTFTIVAKELTSLNISGLGDVQVETLATPSMDINMSGAGRVLQNQITTDNLNINLSGLGGVDISGQATTANINISGAGSVNAPDLQLQTANVGVSGLGGATLWVTDQLTGEISGAGSVSYYGNPQVSTNVSGAGNFKSLGNK